MKIVSYCIALLILLLPAVSTQAGALPALPRADYPVTYSLNYHTDKDASAAWHTEHGSGKPLSAAVGNRTVLQLPCKFRGTRFERASWELPVNLDMSACLGVRFRMYSPDPSPINGLTMYLHSGAGWYGVQFNLEKGDGWSTVTINKALSRLEDNPAGWGRIDMVRLSAWRSKGADTDLYVADLGIVGRKAPVALLRSESIKKTKPAEWASVKNYAEAMAERLDGLGVPYCVISDIDVTLARLRDSRTVVLPYNPEMLPNVVTDLASFLKGNGSMISFYLFPKELEPIVDIKRGTHMKQKRAGYFASIRRASKKPRGLPLSSGQTSWNIFQARPVPRKSEVAAYWFDDRGSSTKEPAVIVSKNCIHVTHVLLSDDPANKQTMLLSMLGHFLPETWKNSARARLDGIQSFGPYRKTGRAADSLRLMGRSNKQILGMISHSEELAASGRKLFGTGKYADAFEAAGDARALLIRSYCMLQEPEADEFRAFWCHSAYGVSGLSWNEAAAMLARNGFTAVFPNMLWGGTAYYPSDVLPVDPEIKKRGDQVELALKACKANGIECHIWKVNWNMSTRVDADFAARMKKDGRTQVSYDGSPKDQWLCPSHPQNQRLEVDSLAEVAAKYDIDGLHLDYIRYPDANTCFCTGCKGRFERLTESRVRDWPAAVRKGGKKYNQWLKFRQDNITGVVAAISRRARRLRPGIKISAAVFSNWRVSRNTIAQDWKKWCDNGYIDFVCPMDYTTDAAQFYGMVKEQAELAGKAACYPGIGISAWPYSDDKICTLLEQINLTRKNQTKGFIVFGLGAAEARDVVPLCGQGITRIK